MFTNPNNLSDIVDKHPFAPNPLDVYENYTYNLELLIVDQEANRKFLTHENKMIPSIVKNQWPGAQDRGITIAKSGVSTELLISDLEIRGVGAGKSRTSKIAGSAQFIEFTITQVGNTNLADTIQNALALLGYKKMQETDFYLKINFLGYDGDGNSITIPNSTKVIPFRIKKYFDLVTQTDARGTTTVIEGGVQQEDVVTDSELSKTQNGFTFVIGKTLKDTLDNFFLQLNLSTKVSHPTLPDNMQNTFSYEVDATFEKYIKSEMGSHLSFDTTQNMAPVGKGSAQPVGTVTPLMNIYEVMTDIVLSANKVKDELTGVWALRHGATHVPKIMTFNIVKEGGYNPVTGNNAVDVIFQIHTEKKILVQNQTHKNAQALESKKIVQEIFDDKYISKIYNYLYTGKNDQVIEFNISLDRALAKTYSLPTDWYGYEHFLESATTEGKHLSAEYQTVLTQAEKDLKQLQKIESNAQKTFEGYKKDVTTARYSLTSAIQNDLQLYKKSIGMPEHLTTGRTIEDIATEVEEGNHSDRWPESTKAHQTLKELTNKMNSSESAYKTAKNITKDDGYFQSASYEFNQRVDAGNELFDRITSKAGGDKSRSRMILAEELDDDVISKLSNEDFDIILKSQNNNPVTFKKLINDVLEPNKNATFKSTDPEMVATAKAKYYESHLNDISMTNAQMTIKGDPFWINGYMSPKRISMEEKLADEKSSTHVNYCIIVSGKSAGVDLYDNVLTKRLITSLYCVTTVDSLFSGGLFTQTLGMVKMPQAETMRSSQVVGGEVIIVEDKEESVADVQYDLTGTPFKTNNKVKAKPDPTIVYNEDNGTYTQFGVTYDALGRNIHGHYYSSEFRGPHYDGLPEFEGADDEDLYNMQAAITAELEAGDSWLYNFTKSFKNLNLSPTSNAPELIEKMADEFVETAELAETLHAATEPGVPELPSGPILRQANAAMYLNELPNMTRACRAEQKRGIKPFVSCDAIEAHNKKILSMFETTPGVPPTIAEINAYLNNNIADAHPTNAGEINESTESHAFTNYGEITGTDNGDGSLRRDRGFVTENVNDTKYSDYEIAMFQIAAGGVLTVEGHDPADIERIVRESSLARTPETIIEEQKQNISSSDINSSTLGAAVNNRILANNVGLNTNESNGILINVLIEEPKSIAEFKVDFDAINALPSSVCDNQCKSVKHYQLSAEMNKAAHQQYYFNKQTERLLEEAEAKAKVNTKNRTLKVNGFSRDSLTVGEQADMDILADGINTILDNSTLTSDEIIRKNNLLLESKVVLKRHILDNNLDLTAADESSTLEELVYQVNAKAALESLSEIDYTTITGYAEASNTIINDVNSGYRANLNQAVNVGKIQGELTNNSLKQDTIINKKYYFDPNNRLADAISLEELESDFAIKSLLQEDEVIGQVATITTAGETEFVEVLVPVSTVSVEKQPVVFKTTGLPLNTYDVLLPITSMKEKLAAVGGDMTMLSQHQEAQKIYQLITSTDTGQMKVVTDDAGVKIKVKDYSTVGMITYIDANGVSQTFDPVALFSLHTTTKADMYPLYQSDFNTIKSGIATLFPNISTTNAPSNGIISRSGRSDLTLDISTNKFIVDPNP